MARAYPVPNYSTIVQLSGTSKRKLNAVSPGTTDSSATIGVAASVTASPTYYSIPETTAVSGTILPVGTANGTGWGFVPSDPSSLVPLNTDGFSLSAGTMTISLYTQAGAGVGQSGITANVTAILFRATANAASFPQELGRAASGVIGGTGTKTLYTWAVSVSAATFAAGDIIWMELFTSCNSSGTANNLIFATNSTASLSITASTCTYTINYNKSLSDTRPVSDSMVRGAGSARALTDAIPVTDAFVKATGLKRPVTDALPTISDATNRLFVAKRAIADSITISDAVVRQYAGNRALTDAVAAADGMSRLLTYTRAMTDALATGGGGTVNNFYPIYLLGD